MKYGIVKVLCIFFMFFLGVNSAYAYNYKKVTDDQRIISALKVLENTGSYDTLELIFQRDEKGKYTQIIFYDLGMISYQFKNHFAMTSRDNFDEKHIIINAKYRNSPKEALAALIAHESRHRAETATLNEEVNATVTELTQWNKSLAIDPQLQNIDNPVVQRLHNLSKIYTDAGEQGYGAISQKITGNAFYRSQFAAGKI